MKRIVILAALAGLFCGPVLAADLSVLPAKAPALALHPYTGYGLYIGANMGGGGGNVNSSSSVVGAQNLVDLQALIGVTAGYAWSMPGGTSWLAVEADFDMMNLSTGGSGLPLTLTGPLDFEQRVLFGFPVTDFFKMLPVIGGINLNLPTLPPFQALPAGVTATNSHMYVFAGIDEKDVSGNFGAMSNKVWLIAPEIGFGNRSQLSNGFATDTSLAVQFDSKGLCVGTPVGEIGCGNLGMQVIGKLKLLY
jgi:opacity protein-like surface antigen